ncbi:NINE protein [Roseofilum casamattae]|uniref:NINE protein n=1 Tax=Roseofilum casamattae BLCC-M143 TaxID=3022442 RepID=A0ABT7BVG1_9CYAN|nr:NINE protein [Roseofilum casamattae]MDJ1183168.1 NINE protein [Roseofilum casamattae BLCC-M143]
MNKVGTSYLFWLLCILQIHGAHRLYNGKIVTGILWFCTLGLFGFGQFIDLLLIPNMVDEYNIKYRLKHGLSPAGVPLNRGIASEVMPTTQAPSDPKVQLLRAAAARGGQISVTQAVIDTGLEFEEVEQLLMQMLKTGYASIDNHPDTGVVVYVFPELMS